MEFMVVALLGWVVVPVVVLVVLYVVIRLAVRHALTDAGLERRTRSGPRPDQTDRIDSPDVAG